MGRAVVRSLSRDMSYIEHVFHSTLFPKALVESLDDEPRRHSVDLWTVASIRNAFIWLTYLWFVENNDANGVSVRGSLRLFAGTRQRVIASLEAILNPKTGIIDRTDPVVIAAAAHAEIRRMIGLWSRRGILKKMAA